MHRIDPLREKSDGVVMMRSSSMGEDAIGSHPTASEFREGCRSYLCQQKKLPSEISFFLEQRVPILRGLTNVSQTKCKIFTQIQLMLDKRLRFPQGDLETRDL